MDALTESFLDFFVIGLEKFFVNLPERIFPSLLSNSIENRWEIEGTAEDYLIILSYGINFIVSHFTELDDQPFIDLLALE